MSTETKSTKTAAARKQAERLIQSNNSLCAALAVLNFNARGKQVLQQLRELASGPATGLDSQGQEAVLALIYEFCRNGRREFLTQWKVSRTVHSEVATDIVYAPTAAMACDMVRAEDSNCDIYLAVESYVAWAG